MRRSRQLVLESAIVSSILIVIALGGSITTTITPSFISLNDPGLVAEQYDLRSLSMYYNLTLSAIGDGEFANASFLLGSFHFVNIPPRVNQTAVAANADLAAINSTLPRAALDLDLAQSALDANDYPNATSLANAGCGEARLADRGLAGFQRTETSRLQSLSVPTALYDVGASLTSAEVQGALTDCDRLQGMLPRPDNLFVITSPQKTVETGGKVTLNGTLILDGAPVGGQEALFYANETYFGSLLSGASGQIGGTLSIPLLYKSAAAVQAVVAPNATLGVGGAVSNLLNFTISFDHTRIVLGDPPTYLPTQSFQTTGNLTTASGVPLPGAPVKVTFLSESLTTVTNGDGEFAARLTVPANATDGNHYVYASFSPEGVFGPSVNFTSVRVAHIPLTVTVKAPYSLAGIPTRLTGSAAANGSPVPGARIVVVTPWGSYSTVTNGSGHFVLGLTVPPLDFGLAAQVHAAAVATEPYVASANTFSSLHFFNALILIFPAVAIATLGYEADKMGTFERWKRGEERKAAQEESPDGGVGVNSTASGSLPEMVYIYKTASGLASSRFGLHFVEGQTIREALSVVGKAGPPVGYEEFQRISLALEEFLYAPRFESSRVEDARRDVAFLEGRWA